VHKGTPHKIKKGKLTHGNIWYLAKRLVLEVRRLLVLCHLKVDGNDLVLEVALFSNQGNAARAGGLRDSVKFECHEVRYCCRMWGERMDTTPAPPSLFLLIISSSFAPITPEVIGAL